jgi:hypothetical protein
MATDKEKIEELTQKLSEFEKGLEKSKKAVDSFTFSSFKDYRETLKAINEELGKDVNLIKEVNSSYSTLTNVAQKFQSQEEGISRLKDDQIDKLKEQARISLGDIKANAETLLIKKGIKQVDKNGLELTDAQYKVKLQSLLASGKIKEEEFALISAQREGFSIENELLEKLEEEGRIRKKSNDLLGIAGGLTKTLSETLGPLANSLGLDDASKAMTKVADEIARGEREGGKLAVAFAGVSSMAGSLGESLKDPSVIFGAIVKSTLEFSKANAEVRNLTGQSATNMNTFNTSMVSSIDAAKTIGSLSKEIGINVNAAFSGETITAAAELTNLLGVSGKAAANLALRAEAFGGTLKGTSEAVYATTKQFIQQNKVALNVGAVMEDVGNASGALALSLGNSTEALTEAAAGAASLGINLAEAEGIADKLLDFENSIANELEAELLTGKEINLEGARQAALNNDIAGLTKEIGENQAIIGAFSSGNRIQQDAIAKSLGMSKDQVANMIFLQQKQSGMTEAQAAAAAGINIEEAKRLGVQESIQKSIEKLTSALAPVLEAIAGTVAILTGNKLGLIATFSVLALVYLPKMAAGIGNFASSIKSGLKDAKALAKSVGGAVSKFASPGEGKKGFVSRIKSAFKSDKIGKTDSISKDPIPEGTDKSAKGLAGVNSKKIKSFFQDLAAGLRAMGKGTFKGIAALALFAPTAVLSIAAIPFLSFIGMVPLKMLQSNLQGLGQGLKSLSKGMMGAVTLLLLAPALALMLIGIPFLTFMAIPGIGALISANFVLLAAGLAAFGNPATALFILIGIGLLTLLGISMIPFAFALSLLTPLIEAFGNIIIGVFQALPPIISAVAEGFVLLMNSITLQGILGMFALGPALLITSVGLMALAGGLLFLTPMIPTLLLFTLAFSLLTPAAEAFGKVIIGVFGAIPPIIGAIAEGFVTMMSAISMENVGALFLLGPALLSASVGMVGFGAAMLFGAPAILGLLAIGGALALLAPNLETFGNVVVNVMGAIPAIIESIANGFALLMSSITPQGILGMFALGPALLITSVGLMALAGGLLFLTPMIPTLLLFSFTLSLLTPTIAQFGSTLIGVFSLLPPIITAVSEGLVTIFGGISDLITSVVKSLTSLADPMIIAGLYMMAPALMALGFSMIPLAWGLTAFALSAGILTVLTGGSPFDMFGKLAEYAPGIDLAATSLSTLAQSAGGIALLAPALALLGFSLIPLAWGLTSFALSAGILTLLTGGGPFDMFGELAEYAPGISLASISLLTLAQSASGLAAVSPALAALGLAMIPLSQGLLFFALSAGLLSIITGGGPFDMFAKLAEYAPGIDLSANALLTMSIALGTLQTALAGIDTEKLKDIMSPSIGGVVLGLGTAAIQGVTDSVQSIAGTFGAGGGGGENDAVVKELEAVKEVLNQILKKEGSVFIDSTKAGTAFAMGTSKLQ